MTLRKPMTLCIIDDGSRILLGMKKRGFGQGRWNGFGGKVQPGESIEDAAIREFQEEAGITPLDLRHCAQLDFTFAGKPDEILEVHIFRITRYDGVPQESEEMRPQWFSHEDIPFDAMWPDDLHWMPLLLAGKEFSGSFHFAGDGIERFELRTVPSAIRL